MEIWNIGYRFAPRTGSVKPWETVNTVTVNGKVSKKVMLSSFKTEEAAIKWVAKKIEAMRDHLSYRHIDCVNAGRV